MGLLALLLFFFFQHGSTLVLGQKSPGGGGLLVMAAATTQQQQQAALADRVNEALQLHKGGQLGEALAAYSSLVGEVPPQLATSLHSNTGAIHSALGDYDAAAQSFIAAIASSPDNAQAHFNLAVTLTSKLNKHETALEHCKTALRLNPAMHKALHLIGNILQSLGRGEEAVDYFVRAEEVATVAVPPTVPAATSLWTPLLAKSLKVGDRIEAEVEGQHFPMECISERPLLFHAPSLLSDEECDHVVSVASPRLEKSEVMGGTVEVAATADGGRETTDRANSYRLSENTWIPSHNDQVIRALQLRLASLVQVSPAEALQGRFEDLQVVRYKAGTGGQFRLHQDSSRFHQRAFTALIYLNTLSSGGETFFPHAPSTAEANLKFNGVSTEESIELGEKVLGEGMGLKFTPVKGSAIIFANHLLASRTTTIDTAAVHAGLPVRDEDKWICNFWWD